MLRFQDGRSTRSARIPLIDEAEEDDLATHEDNLAAAPDTGDENMTNTMVNPQADIPKNSVKIAQQTANSNLVLANYPNYNKRGEKKEEEEVSGLVRLVTLLTSPRSCSLTHSSHHNE